MSKRCKGIRTRVEELSLAILCSLLMIVLTVCPWDPCLRLVDLVRLLMLL